MTTRVRAGDYADPADYARALASDEAVVEEDTLGGFDVVFLRYNPAREGEARPGAPLIDFGWRLRLAGTLVVNDPEGMRRAGSRMYLADFPADVRTRTLVSRSKVRLKAFLQGARRARGAQAAGAARRRARLLPAPPPGLEPEPDHRRRDQGRLRAGAGVPPRGRAGGKAPPAAQRRADPDRRPGGDLPPPAHGRRTVAKAGGVRAQQVRLRPRRGAHLRHPAAEAAGRRPELRGVDIVGDRILELNVFTPGGLHSIHELYGVDASAS